MATSKEISKIKAMAAEGQSVNSIKEDLELPKSTVYYHFRKEVGQKQKSRSPELPENDDFRGELCGIFAGDGSFQKAENGSYKISFHLNSKEKYWRILKNYLEKRLNRAPSICDSQKSKVALLYNSKGIYLMLKDYLDWEEDKTSSVQLKNRQKLPREFKLGFLRGLIDTDGYRRPGHKRYVFTSASSDLADNFANITRSLAIENSQFVETDNRSNRSSRHKVRITGADVDIFQEIVEPRKPKRRY